TSASLARSMAAKKNPKPSADTIASPAPRAIPPPPPTSSREASTTPQRARASPAHWTPPGRSPVATPITSGTAAAVDEIGATIALDAVRTPFGDRERMLGGSAVHFSLAASFFTDVRVVGPVGDDFGPEQYEVLNGRGVITDDIEHVRGGQTFFWRGHYDYDLNTAHTDETQLNVFGDFEPKLSEASRESEVLFLANIQPDLQRGVREQCANARFVAMDSMNLWIETARDPLRRTIADVDAL